MNKREIVLIGGFSEVIEAIIECGLEINGIVDSEQCSSYKYLGNDEAFLSSGNRNIPILISPDKPNDRERLFEMYFKAGFEISTFIHSQTYKSPTCSIEKGCFINRMAHLSSHVIIGKGSRVNVMANIMHHSKIGEFTTIAPNAVILGYVNIGSHCYIGSNSTILPYIDICDNVIIGAGAVVTRNILKPGTYLGIPARKK
jgi:UDP-N-acetylbacillosamine N-acetyltransferase